MFYAETSYFHSNFEMILSKVYMFNFVIVSSGNLIVRLIEVYSIRLGHSLIFIEVLNLLLILLLGIG